MREKHVATILNSRYYCPDGAQHAWYRARRWLFQHHDRCMFCHEWRPR